MIDKDFEAFCEYVGLPTVKNTFGEYCTAETAIAKRAWMASRGFLVVSLSDKLDGRVISVNDVKNALDAVGVRYK